ncbi:MAG: hypothetical protein ACFNT7_07140 [Porphyromonas pasteri]
MKKIIGLYGLPNTGKTTTLKRLIGLFGEKANGEKPVTIDDYRGKKIVIAPGGDTLGVVKANVKTFKEEKADILVSATRTKGGSQDALKEHAKKIGTDVIWVGKNHSASLHEFINEVQVQELRAFIDLIIDNWDSEPKK